MALTNKYVVWLSAWEGKYVVAEEAVEDDDTVSFLKNLTAIASYKKKDILKYYKVEE